MIYKIVTDDMTSLLNIDNLKYYTGSQEILISGRVMPQSVLNIRGPSGSGKTTLLRILARLSESVSGTVFLKGKSWLEFSSSSWRHKIHYFSQKPVIFDGTVKENILKPFELSLFKHEFVIDMYGLDALMERMLLSSNLLDRDARNLSGGEAARVALIRALLTQPDIMMLDEPLASLDSKTAEAVLRTLTDWCLEKEDHGIIMVSHVGDLDKLPGYQIIDLSDKIVSLEGDSVE